LKLYFSSCSSSPAVLEAALPRELLASDRDLPTEDPPSHVFEDPSSSTSSAQPWLFVLMMRMRHGLLLVFHRRTFQRVFVGTVKSRVGYVILSQSATILSYHYDDAQRAQQVACYFGVCGVVERKMNFFFISPRNHLENHV
jgi:hypothetical protein